MAAKERPDMSDTTEHKPGKPGEPTLEIIFTVEGDPSPHSQHIDGDADADEALKAIRKALSRSDLEEISVDDADTPLPKKARIADATADGQILHVSSKGEIEVVVSYSIRDVKRDFRPNATVGGIIAWAISSQGLKLEGDPSDFQLKLGNTVLTPDQHLGSIARGQKRVDLSLVFKVKPQG